MEAELWWQCERCNAIFRADNNLCICCGATTKRYEDAPKMFEIPGYERRFTGGSETTYLQPFVTMTASGSTTIPYSYPYTIIPGVLHDTSH